MRRDATGGALALALLAATLCLSQDEDFDARWKEAERNREASDGKEYEDAFAKEFGAHYATSLTECAKETGEQPTEGFDLLLKVGARGTVEDALVRPATKFSVCFKGLTKQMTFGVPPSPGYWVLAAVRFKRQ